MIKTFFYIIAIVLALVGNLLIMVVVFRNKRMQTTTNFYIVNLAVADLLVATVCSWVHLVNDLVDGWVLGLVFCKLNSFLQGETPHVASDRSIVSILGCLRVFHSFHFLTKESLASADVDGKEVLR